MRGKTDAVITHAEARPREAWDDSARGDVTWVTLISGDLTPTTDMSAGIAEFAPRGGHLALHRHAQPEIYVVLEGAGIVTIDGRDTPVAVGDTVYIPGDAEHGVRNEGDAVLRLFYVFPTDRFEDVVYRFSA